MPIPKTKNPVNKSKCNAIITPKKIIIKLVANAKANKYFISFYRLSYRLL